MAGATLLVTGGLLVLTPLPGVPVILAGLTLLATEFAWARRWRRRIERAAAGALEALRERLGMDDELPSSGSVDG